MPIERKIWFLNKVIKSAAVVSGDKFRFIVKDGSGFVFDANITLEAVTPDSMRLTSLSPDMDSLSTSTRSVDSSQEYFFANEEIANAYIPSRIPGVKTTFKWTPTQKFSQE